MTVNSVKTAGGGGVGLLAIVLGGLGEEEDTVSHSCWCWCCYPSFFSLFSDVCFEEGGDLP